MDLDTFSNVDSLKIEEYDVRHYMRGNILSLFESGQTFPKRGSCNV